MGAPRKLDSDRTLADMVEEALFTKLMVRNSPEAKGLAAAADKMHGDAETQLTRERALYPALLDAEVRVAIANRLLDEWVDVFRALLLGKESSGGGDLTGRFFGGRRPSDVIKMALGSELAVVEPWIESLKADADADLKAQGAALEKRVAEGRAALTAHKAARQAIKDFRTGPRAQVFEQVNSGRVGLYGDLRELDKGKKDAAWAESFFRARRASAEEPDLLSVEEATAALETHRAAVKAAEAELEAAQQRAALAQAATAAREAKEKERDTARKEMARLRSRLAELEDELR